MNEASDELYIKGTRCWFPSDSQGWVLGTLVRRDALQLEFSLDDNLGVRFIIFAMAEIFARGCGEGRVLI